MSVLEHAGASLSYWVAGHVGRPPVLLLLGGLDEGGAASSLVQGLARDHHVITYDRRGLGLSAEDDATASLAGDRITLHANDAAAVVKAVLGDDQPVHVVSVCLGALIGLRLLELHSELVGSLSVHEPPIETLKCEASRIAWHDNLSSLAINDPRAAAKEFAALTGRGDPVEDESAILAPRNGSIAADVQHFFAHDFKAVRAYTPNIEALRSTRQTIYATGGSLSRGRFEYECTHELATQLNIPFEEIATGHAPLITFPRLSEDLIRRRVAAAALGVPQPRHGESLTSWGFPWFSRPGLRVADSPRA